MSVKIRMKRLGAKKKPFYRIVVADSRAPRNGRFIEEIGYYNPISEPRKFSVDADKVKQWIKNGAKPSDTVARLFKLYSVLESEGLVKVGEDQVKKVVSQPAPAEKTEAPVTKEEEAPAQEEAADEKEEKVEEDR